MVMQTDYIVKCLDPLHVGCGSFTIEKVDMPVLRETGTRLPLIPGSSLSGVLRSLMAYEENKKRDSREVYCYPGTGSSQERRHCGSASCPVCTVFGYAGRDREISFHKGCATFTDASLLLFPVYSNRLGPVWITSPSSLEKLAVSTGAEFEPYDTKEHLLLGWDSYNVQEVWDRKGILSQTGLSYKIFQLSDRDFSNLVDHSLEMRTAVSIDAVTGTAEEKHLFNYEAVPRNAVFAFSVILYPYLLDAPEATLSLDELAERITRAVDGLSWYGVGGMNTRGLGRMARIWPSEEADQK